MMEAEQYDPWLTGCLGYWSHTLRAYAKSAVWDSDPKLEVYRNGTDNQFWSGYKGPISHAAGAVAAEYIDGADVRRGRLRPGDTAGGGARGRAPLAPVLSLIVEHDRSKDAGFRQKLMRGSDDRDR